MARRFATGAPSLTAPKLSSSHVASAALGSKSDTRAVPRVFEKPKERLHDRRGRPNAHMEIIKKEAQRRVDADDLPDLRQLSVFARVLCTWFRKTHPKLPQPTPRSVETAVRVIWARRRKSI